MRAHVTWLVALVGLGLSSCVEREPLATAEMPVQEGDLVVSMEGLRWQARPLLVFAPRDDDPLLVRQLAVLRDGAEGLVERAMPVLVIVDAGDSRIDGEVMADASASAIREKFATGGFEVVLIGKDGGVKLRSVAVVLTDELFALVDSMPMRRREMGG